MRRGVKAGIVGLVGCTAMLLSACGGDASSADDESVIRVGTLMPMTGPQEALSNSYRSMEAYFQMVNENGGIDGRRVELIVRDDQFNPAQSPAMIRELVDQENVQMMCANQGSGTFKAISGYLSDHGIGAVPMSGESSLFTDESTGYQILPPYEYAGAHLVRFSVDDLKHTKIAIAYTEDGVGLPFRAGALEQLEAMGIEPVAEIQFNASATDQGPAAAKLKDSGAEIVLVNHTAPIISQLVRATDRLGYRPDWGLTYATLNKQVLELSGEALQEHAYFVTPYPDSDAEQLEEYRSTMSELYPNIDQTDFLTVEGWIVGSVCADIIERASGDGATPDKAALLDAMGATDISNDLVRGLTWTPNERFGQRELQILAPHDEGFDTVSDFQPAPDVTLGAS